MYMKFNRFTYLIILIFLAIFYFGYLKKNNKVSESFLTTVDKLNDSCTDCESNCKPDYNELCLKTVQACVDCRSSKQGILPKSWISIEPSENQNDVYELSKKLNPEILIINQMVNTDNFPNSGIQPTMTNIQLSAHPYFDDLDYAPKNLITGMFTDNDPVPSNSTLERKDNLVPKYKKI